jgi:hypothetical protein
MQFLFRVFKLKISDSNLSNNCPICISHSLTRSRSASTRATMLANSTCRLNGGTGIRFHQLDLCQCLVAKILKENHQLML